ncbi:hypothetical protein [Thalassospira sp. HJ]|nr:hypothetical protein [Thalassospira sp. HJ]
MRASVGEHRKIIKALRDNDAEGARRETKPRVRNTARYAGLQT